MILAILQARLSSTRFPGKVLKPILGSPMLMRQIERIKRASLIDVLLVATTNEVSDDPICQLCDREGIKLFRGSLTDVLDRYYQAATDYSPDHVVRLTADCPLIDPEIIDQVIQKHLNEGNDYTSNVFPATFAHGLDVEVFTIDLLKRVWLEAKSQYDREHVSPYMRKLQGEIKLGNLLAENDFTTYRWTVDYKEDYQLVLKIYEHLYLESPNFTTDDIIQFLKNNSELLSINTDFKHIRGDACCD